MTIELAKAKQILVGGANPENLQDYLDITLEASIGSKVDKDGTKVLSDENYTSAEKTKLSDLPTNATLTSSLSGKVNTDGAKVLSDNNFTTALKNKVDGLPEGSALTSALSGKVDTVAGKSLIADTPATDGKQYAIKDGVWAEVVAGGGDVEEAPIDGKQYARKDAGWEEVAAGGGGGGDVEEAPEDGKIYGRKDGLWEATSPFKLEVSEDFASLLFSEGYTELDASLYPECREILEQTPDYLVAELDGAPMLFTVRYLIALSGYSAELGVDRYLMAEIKGAGLTSRIEYLRLEGDFEEGLIETFESGGFKSYLSTQDITSEVLSGVPYFDPNGRAVGIGEALSGGIFYKFDTSATGAYSIQIKQSNINTVMSFAGEGGVSSSEFSFYAPFQSHSSSYLEATWAGCTLSGASLLSSGS